jgi:hypothetical protein
LQIKETIAVDLPPLVKADEPNPLVHHGSLQHDIKLGWKPQQVMNVAGAPIPLHYNFEHFNPPINPLTNTEYEAFYLGPRHANSHGVHKAYARQNGHKVNLYDCDNLS